MKSLPPGSEGLPLFGETLAFARDPFQFFAERAERHGPVFRTSLLGRKTICLSGPEAFDCSTRGELFQRQDASPASWQELLTKDAVPFLDGDAHRIRKRILLQAVGPKALPNFLPTLVQLVDAALARAGGREVAFVDEAADLAFRVTETLFAAGDPESPTTEIRQAFDAFTQGVFAPAVPLPFSKYSGARRAAALLKRRFLERIAMRRAQPSNDVLSGLLQAEFEGVRLSDDEAAAETLHFFSQPTLVSPPSSLTFYSPSPSTAKSGSPRRRRWLRCWPDAIRRWMTSQRWCIAVASRARFVGCTL